MGIREEFRLTKKSVLKKVAKHKKRKEVERYQKTKTAKKEAELYSAQARKYEQKKRLTEAKREASPFRGLLGGFEGKPTSIKKKKQGGKIKKRTHIQMF